MKCPIILFVVLASVRMGLSIRCYECNSVNNSMCIDPTSYDADTVQKFIKTTDCEQGVYTPDSHVFFCRKIVQTILHKHHDSEVRVNRGCGWVQHHKDCYKADNEDHLETVCQCFTDQCNSAPLAQLSALAVAAAALIGLNSI